MRTRRFTAIASVLALVFMLVGMVPAGAKPEAKKPWNIFQDKLGAYTCTTATPKGQIKVAGPYDTQALCLATLSTPPTINYELTGTLGSNGWYTSNVFLDWTITDAPGVLPGVMQVTGGVDTPITADQQATTYSASATSIGGSAGPVEVTIALDATKPTILVGPGIANGDSFEIGSVPAEPTFEASDAMSGIDTSSFTGYGTAIGTYTLTGTATDLAGNTANIDPIGYTVTAHQATVVEPTKTDQECNGPGSVVPGGLTIPSVTGIDYFVDGTLTAGGFHEMPDGVYQVTAQAQTDYELVGYPEGGWSLKVIAADCIVPVTSVAPTATDETADSMGFISIPPVEGLVYSIDGSPAAGDMYLVPGTYQVTAEALFGYTLVGDSSWSLTINAYVPPIIEVEPYAPGSIDQQCDASGQIVLPPDSMIEGYAYSIEGIPVTGGWHPAEPGVYAVTANALAGYTLVNYPEGGWTVTVMPATGCIIEVTPAAPTATDETATASGFITIPTSEGVDYALDGVAVAAGNYDRNPGNYLVEASAQPGYALAAGATSSWTLAINPYVPPKVIEFVGVTSAGGGQSAVLPAGWQPGDLAIWMGTRWGATTSTTYPTIPAGYTGTGRYAYNKPGTYYTTSTTAWRILQASDTVMPASSTSHDAILVVYRNASIGSVAGASCGSGTCSLPTTYAPFPALTLQNVSGTSWVAGLASNNKGVTATGLFARTNPGTGAMSALDTNGGVASWASHPSVGAQHAFSIELKLVP